MHVRWGRDLSCALAADKFRSTAAKPHGLASERSFEIRPLAGSLASTRAAVGCLRAFSLVSARAATSAPLRCVSKSAPAPDRSPARNCWPAAPLPLLRGPRAFPIIAAHIRRSRFHPWRPSSAPALAGSIKTLKAGARLKPELGARGRDARAAPKRSLAPAALNA